MSFFITCSATETFLNFPINLNDYEVSVVDFHITGQAFQLSQAYAIKTIEHDTEKEISVPGDSIAVSLRYPLTILNIVKSVSKALENSANVELSPDGKLHIDCNDNTSLLFPLSLSRILGFDSPLFVGKRTAASPIDPEIFSRRLLITSNFTKPNQVNERFFPIIYAGPLDYHSDIPVYHKTIGREISFIRLDFYNTLMERANVAKNTFSIVLHFRKSS